tara:strand:+ start:264 stop:533 length:270 start_codon:yes stop_codon:yes gene_type:complete
MTDYAEKLYLQDREACLEIEAQIEQEMSHMTQSQKDLYADGEYSERREYLCKLILDAEDKEMRLQHDSETKAETAWLRHAEQLGENTDY